MRRSVTLLGGFILGMDVRDMRHVIVTLPVLSLSHTSVLLPAHHINDLSLLLIELSPYQRHTAGGNPFRALPLCFSRH